jgi:hypothetical protein
MDDERRQILEEAVELDHIWGAWSAEEEPTKLNLSGVGPVRGLRGGGRRGWCQE